MAVAALAATAPAPASAAITPLGCVADAPASGCRALPAGSLRGASSVAVGTDRVYVAAYGSGQVLAFRRPGLAAAGCAIDCSTAPPYALQGAAAVALAGRDLYAVSGLGRSLTRFTTSPFAFAGCVADFGRSGCADPEPDTLAGAGAVAAAGGRDLYVASFDGAAVTHFRRTATGPPELVGCIADAGAHGCTRTRRNVLEGASAVVVAGRDVYVAAFQSGGIVWLRRAADGSLTYRGCVADEGANGCAKVPVDSLVGVSGLAVSGRRLYAAAQSGTVAAFTRRPSGALRFAGCAGADGPRGCAGARTLAGASSVAASKDRVYVAAQRSDAITELDRKLRTRSCTARRVKRCRRGPARALTGVYAVAVRGRELYAASPTAASLSRFALSSRGSRPRSGGQGS